ncbi:Dabb family protein [Actinophytocola sediminis]
MIVNIVRFRFKDTTTDTVRAEVLAAMRRTASVESVAFATVGQDIGDPAEGYTHAYLAAVEDLAALDRYFYDPVHLNGDADILPHFARLTTLQLSDDPDPELGAKIGAMHLKKVAAYPEWGRLLDAIPDVNVPTEH